MSLMRTTTLPRAMYMYLDSYYVSLHCKLYPQNSWYRFLINARSHLVFERTKNPAVFNKLFVRNSYISIPHSHRYEHSCAKFVGIYCSFETHTVCPRTLQYALIICANVSKHLIVYPQASPLSPMSLKNN